MVPDISVIIPAYNNASYLGTAVESALTQQGCTVEVIVVDDCSTDDTLTAARAINDPRVRVLANKSNRGPSFSRNRALEEATGEWVAVLDSDDWFAPGRIARLLEVATARGADMVADDLYLIRDGAKVPFTTHFALARRHIEGPFSLTSTSFVASNREGLNCLRLGVTKPLIRRRFLEQHGIRYDEDVRFSEDFRFYLLCLLRGACFWIIPEPHYYRRRHPGSITARDIVGLLETELRNSALLLEHPLIRQNEAVMAALRRRSKEIERHLAFRRIRRSLQARELRAALGAINVDAASFVVQRLADRFRGQMFTLRHHVAR